MIICSTNYRMKKEEERSYFCEPCMYKTTERKNFGRHLKSARHISKVKDLDDVVIDKSPRGAVISITVQSAVKKKRERKCSSCETQELSVLRREIRNKDKIITGLMDEIKQLKTIIRGQEQDIEHYKSELKFFDDIIHEK